MQCASRVCCGSPALVGVPVRRHRPSASISRLVPPRCHPHPSAATSATSETLERGQHHCNSSSPRKVAARHACALAGSEGTPAVGRTASARRHCVRAPSACVQAADGCPLRPGDLVKQQTSLRRVKLKDHHLIRAMPNARRTAGGTLRPSWTPSRSSSDDGDGRRGRLPRALSAPGRGSRRRAAPKKAVAVARVSVPPRAALGCGERSCPGGRSRRGRATDQPAWPDWPLLLQGARDWRQDPV